MILKERCIRLAFAMLRRCLRLTVLDLRLTWQPIVRSIRVYYKNVLYYRFDSGSQFGQG